MGSITRVGKKTTITFGRKTLNGLKPILLEILRTSMGEFTMNLEV
jgi:hypothetical protein